MVTVNIDDFLDRKIAVHCNTKENAEEFVNFLLMKDVYWFDELLAGYEDKGWGFYKEQTGYVFQHGIRYSDVSVLSALGFDVIEYEDFSKEDTNIDVCTPKELEYFILGNSDFVHT